MPLATRGFYSGGIFLVARREIGRGAPAFHRRPPLSHGDEFIVRFTGDLFIDISVNCNKLFHFRGRRMLHRAEDGQSHDREVHEAPPLTWGARESRRARTSRRAFRKCAAFCGAIC